MTALPPVKDRVVGEKYIKEGRIRIWDGKLLKCEHNKRENMCKECGGYVCEHRKYRNECIECGGASICVHTKRRYHCRKCNGTGICQHNKRKAYCVECNGNQVCSHGIRKDICKECNGNQICYHGKIKYWCKKCGGSSYCKHSVIKYRCKECKGSEVCIHNRLKKSCKICDPDNYLIGLLRRRIYTVTKTYTEKRAKHTIQYLGCTLEELRNHLENQFQEGMTWENQGEWHIDHITPCASFDLSKEEERENCFHYTNLQPLWAKDNLIKGSKVL